ncbi:cytochrome P450 2B1-like [Clavelina lepadiformis]|uniref:cytochrome P450 2B1-like n=1 Tax=Clavelina lepadiformis TaxID=159417 RepID=UPI00404243FA
MFEFLTGSNLYAAIALLVTLITSLLLWWYKRPPNFPSGPRGIPLFGVIPFLGKNPPETLWRWSRIYGNPMSVRFGRTEAVVLCGYDIINEALVKQSASFSGRPCSPTMFDAFHRGRGISFLDYGQLWKSQRTFGLRTLKGVGVGRKTMEERVTDEMEYLTDRLLSKQGIPFNIESELTNAAANIICNIVIGRRFAYDDDEFHKVVEMFAESFSRGSTGFLFYMTMFEGDLRHVPPFKGAYQRVAGYLDDIRDFVRGHVVEHKLTFDKNYIRDFCDAFLESFEDTDENTEQLVHYIQDLLVAGIETTSSTLRWAILCLLVEEGTQEKIYQEIKSVVGEHRMPLLRHKLEMDYTRSFIEETMRFRAVVPLSPSHKTTDDVILNGKTIPKNTEIIANLWSVNNDPETWNNPKKFDPRRHLDNEGCFIQSKKVLPFSLGPRHCLGQDIAKAEVFLFLVNIIRKFKLSVDPSAPPSADNGKHGSAFVPAPFNLIVTPRF